jgi:4-hydroxy-tetrahydrodipicolinate synthase
MLTMNGGEMSDERDPLWVPILSHYRGGAIDRDRMASQIGSLLPFVRQFLVGGSTGDGWEHDDAAAAALTALACNDAVFRKGTKLLLASLRPTTDAVVARAVAIERQLAEAGAGAASVVGLAICPPVDAAASQEAILRHYRAVMEATTLPIAVYQLPQVTGCAIAPETMRTLAAEPRVVMFKDSSGLDVVAKAGAAKGVVALRGAEGGFAEALAPEGPYDGWLLSSGNAVPEALRAIATHLESGERDRAAALSARTTTAIARLFEAVKPLAFGNAFSNANRAADHIRAYRGGWRAAPPPVTISGATIPAEILAVAAAEVSPLLPEGGRGYLA